MAVGPRLTTRTKEELSLKPALRRKLELKLQEYAGLAAAKEEIVTATDDMKAEIEVIREELGLKSFGFLGFNVSRREDTMTYIDLDMAVSEGWLSQAQREEITKTKPKKAFTQITCPKGE